MTNNFFLIQSAVDDLKNIGQYTLNKWGTKQRNKYLHSINDQFQNLANSPYTGRMVKALNFDDLRVYRYQVHYIFYFIIEKGVVIIGIIHEKMDAIKHIKSRL